MSTLALTPEAPVSNRTRKQQGLSSPPPRAPRARRMQWTPLASVAAALLVIIASFGVWYTSGNESTPPPPESRQVAGLAPGELLQVATPETSYACDFTQDMPIVSSSEELPIEGTYLVWQQGGDLTLRCDEEAEDVVLATGINQAGPVEHMPGIAVAYAMEEGSTDPAAGYSIYINVTNGELYETGSYQAEREFHQDSWGEYWSGNYLFVLDKDGFLVGLDTRTMTTFSVSELFGEGAPESFNLVHGSSEDGSLLAMAVAEPMTDGRAVLSALPGSEIGTEGDILLLNTETGETHWLVAPGENPLVQSIMPSPDGSMLRLQMSEGGDLQNRQSSIMIVSTDDGSLISQSAPVSDFGIETLWTDSGLVVQTHEDLILLPIDGTESRVLYSLDSATNIQGLLPTLDPNKVVITAIECDGECNIATAALSVVVLDVSTGETEVYSGQNIASMTWAETANLLLMTDPGVASPDTTIYTVIDPISGETVAEFDDIPGIGMVERQMPLIGAKSIGISADGQTLVVSIGMQYMIELKSDGTEHSARQLPTPDRWEEEGSGNPTTSIFLSPDGTQLSAMAQGDEAQTRFMLDLTDPDAEWVTVETIAPGGGGFILFVEGVPED